MGNRDRALGSAFVDLFNGEHQEWQLGLEYEAPIGNRVGHLAIRNAELMLARERALLEDQELKILEEVSTAFAEVDRAHMAIRIDYNRLEACAEEFHEIRRKYEAGFAPLDFLLDSNIRTTEAESEYYRSLANFDVAVCRVSLAVRRWTITTSACPKALLLEMTLRSAAKEARRFVPEGAQLRDDRAVPHQPRALSSADHGGRGGRRRARGATRARRTHAVSDRGANVTAALHRTAAASFGRTTVNVFVGLCRCRLLRACRRHRGRRMRLCRLLRRHDFRRLIWTPRCRLLPPACHRHRDPWMPRCRLLRSCDRQRLLFDAAAAAFVFERASIATALRSAAAAFLGRPPRAGPASVTALAQVTELGDIFQEFWGFLGRKSSGVGVSAAKTRCSEDLLA